MFKGTLIHEAAIPRRCRKAVKLVQSIQLTYGSANNAMTVKCEMAWKKREHMDTDVIMWSHSKLELLQKMLMWASRKAGFDRNIWLYIKWNINGCALCFGNRKQASLLDFSLKLFTFHLSDFRPKTEHAFRKSWVHFFKGLNSTNILHVSALKIKIYFIPWYLSPRLRYF